ncbi:Cytochrome c oxidase subunit 1 [Candidatus Thermoflexus japonica]|uniref:Cytochrome c oxidase subunit 1 n=1 Tax=Candidatus Thermoflexus japonica TaxID=2035417 RepID=A0A2H5Y3K5_9CHLR|nr:Cytochrome c oxidase subunit 1 [Candidatus Thermoflexus japonica]
MSIYALPHRRESTRFRTCPLTGVQVDMVAEQLIRANLSAAFFFLAVGGFGGLLLILTRWPVFHLLPSRWFYRILTLHGFDMINAWMVFFEIGALYFCGTALLSTRLVAPRVAWGAFLLMGTGVLMVNGTILAGLADVMFTAFVPLKAHPFFYVGNILFMMGALIALILFLVTLWNAWAEGKISGSLPLVVFGLAVADILGIYSLISGLFAFTMTLGWLLGWWGLPDPGIYRLMFWGFGHGTQQINLAATVSVWYLLAALVVGAVPLNEKLSRLAFVLYAFFVNLGSNHHLLVDPGFSFLWKVFNTSYAMYLAVLGSLIHAFTIPGAVEVSLRGQGHRQGWLGWLRRAPWTEPGFAALAVSMILFGWIGGVTGVTIGTEQINLLVHNTLQVPGHFHAILVGGSTLAFMGLTYYLIPLIFQRPLRWKGLATAQIYIYGFGVALFSVGFIAAGYMGVPRRHWDITFAQAPFHGLFGDTVYLALGIAGVGGLIAVAGGILFFINLIIALLQPMDSTGMTGGLRLQLPAGRSTADPDLRDEPRGTFLLAVIFLLFFGIYYAANWVLLGSQPWSIH